MFLEKNLDKFDIEERILFKEIEADKLTLTEARERCSKLWELIPTDMDLNPVGLNNLMKEKYGNDPEFHKYSQTFTIPWKDIRGQMSNKHRANILRAAKKNPKWSSKEGTQDEIIDEECRKRFWTINDFYNTDGKTLNKLLGE